MNEQDVWAMLDRDRLRTFAESGPPPVFATVSGAHLYGFASPDSDIDLRGAFLLPVRDFLGLRAPNETMELMSNSDIELDWVAHDLRKFARLLTQHNGYVLEQLYSPLVVIGGSDLDSLRQLAKPCITRPTVRHYKGFARSRRKRLGEPQPSVKHLLYAYRVLLSGIHLMRTGEVNANLPELNAEFKLPAVAELIARKQSGSERMLLGASELGAAAHELDALESLLDDAYTKSSLPEEADARELEQWVIDIRLKRYPG